MGPEVLVEPGSVRLGGAALWRDRICTERREGCTHPGACSVYQHSRRTEVREQNSVEGTGSFDREGDRTSTVQPLSTKEVREVSHPTFLLTSKRMTERERGFQFVKLSHKQPHVPKRAAVQPACLVGCDPWSLPWRRYGEGLCSLILAGSSLSLLGHLLALQQHVADEQPHKQEQQEACGQWEEDSVGSGQEVLVDDMLAVNEWQKDHPSGVVGEDDQANSDEAKSHRLVCPGGLEKDKVQLARWLV